MKVQKIDSAQSTAFKGKPVKGLKYIEKNLVRNFYDAEMHLCSETLDKKTGKKLLFVFGDKAKSIVTEVHSKTKNILTRFLIDQGDGNVGAIKNYTSDGRKKLNEIKYLTFDGKVKFAQEKEFYKDADLKEPAREILYQIINNKEVKRIETAYFNLNADVEGAVPLWIRCTKLYDKKGIPLDGFSFEPHEILQNRLIYIGNFSRYKKDG